MKSTVNTISKIVHLAAQASGPKPQRIPGDILGAVWHGILDSRNPLIRKVLKQLNSDRDVLKYDVQGITFWTFEYENRVFTITKQGREFGFCWMNME